MNELKQFALQLFQVWCAVIFIVGTVAFVSLPVQLGALTVAERPAVTHLT